MAHILNLGCQASLNLLKIADGQEVRVDESLEADTSDEIGTSEKESSDDEECSNDCSARSTAVYYKVNLTVPHRIF